MKRFAIVFPLIILVLVFSSCNRSGTASQAEGRTDLNLVVLEVFSNMDPHYLARLVDGLIAYQIYESLFLVEDDQSMTPSLAERYEVSPDGLVYTFHLRRGVTFCNGDVFTADDVIFSLERAMTSPVLFTETEQIESFEKVDDYTVRIRSKDVSAVFARYVSGIFIVNSRHVQQVGDISENPCGTGAYMFESQRRNVNITLTANENYWRGAPSIKTLNWEIMGNAAAALISFEAGELDLISVPSANWEAVKAQNRWTTELYPLNHVTFILMNNEIPPFNDIRIRQALSHAINREDMILLAMDGLAEPALTMANPNLVFGATSNVTVYDYNPQRARQLLAEAGYPNGLSIPPISTMGGVYFENVAITLQGALREIGITANIEVRDSVNYIPSLIAGDYSVGVIGATLVQDMDAYRQLYHTNAIDNSLNVARFSNARADELFDIGIRTIDTRARQAIYAELTEILQREAPYAPVFYRSQPIAHDRNLNYAHRLSFVLYRQLSWNN